MKRLRLLWLALVAIAAIGFLVFLVLKTQAVDNTVHQQRLHNLRVTDALDVGLNRAVTQVGANTLANVADVRAVTTAQLGDALNALEEGPAALRGLDPAIDAALDKFLNTIESKFELAFDFEARNILVNQRLIAGMDAIPALVDQAGTQITAAERERLGSLLAQLRSEVTAYGVVPAPTNEANIMAVLKELTEAGRDQPSAYREAVSALTLRINDVVADKKELVARLSDFLGRPTAQELQAVEQAYTSWHNSKVSVANQYRLWLVAYAAILLLGMVLLGLRLARSFRQLDHAYAKLSHANQTLEGKVERRTRDLKAAVEEVKASQAQLVQSEKMASLGQMVAGVAHEINTPLGYARSNTEIVRTSLREIKELCAAQIKALRLMGDEHADVEEVANTLAEAQMRAEQLNTEELAEDLDNLLGDADHGLSQIAELVRSLKDFSRVDRSRSDVFNINDGLDAALKIANSQIKHRVEVVRSYGQVPPIECSPSQLNQVFLNLFTNAAQAIQDHGKLFIHTSAKPDNGGVVVRVMDTGSGMPEDVRKRIFEPFFTTKAVGQGTGLGLSIVYRIIQDHGGTIDVRSTPGKGTEFIINLPLKQKRSDGGQSETYVKASLAEA
ncbi:MAG TPA: ATP-binding protein [Solimonas sp.]